MVVDLHWDIHLSDTQVWQREAIMLEVSVQATDKFARLWADNFQLAGAKVVALPLQVTKSNTTYQHHLSLRWRITPQSAGQKTLQLPTIHYSLNGGNKVNWQPPTQTFTVQALPPYFPPTLPIGKVAIDSFIEPKGILRPDHLAYWHINLSSRQLTPEQFPPLLKQLHNQQEFEVFPAILSRNLSFEKAHFQQHYQIPIKAKHNGQLALPKLEWHWFDPDTGRLQKQSYQPPRPLVLSITWQVMIVLLLVGIASIGVYHLKHMSYHAYQRWSSRRQLHHALLTPDNKDRMHNAMLRCAIVHHWPPNFSIAQWLLNWEKYYGEDQALRQALQIYEAHCFA